MQKEKIENNPLLRTSLEFSLEIINYCELLNSEKKFIVSNQLLRSGTSIGANCFEAQNAESKSDFIHKLKIAAKESDETQYWLILCSVGIGYPDCQKLCKLLLEIQKLLTSIITSSKNKN